MKKIFLLFGLVLFVSCGIFKPVPPQTSTTVTVRDSTIIHIKDSVRVIEKSIYKDYTGLLDTLKIKNEGRASMTAWADTSKNIIAGELVTEPIEEKTKILYRDRIVVRDSIQVKEVPVEVPVEKEVVPRWCWRLLFFNILLLVGFGVWVFLKIKKKVLPIG